MRHRLLTAAFVLLSLAAAAAWPPSSVAAERCPYASTLPGDGAEGALAKGTVCLLNRERARRGMRALRVDRRLSRAAHSHARDMVERSYFEHASRTGESVVDRLRDSGYIGRVRNWLVGENLARGTGTRGTPRQIVIAWMNSPGHRRNVLNRRFREVGTGVVFGVRGRGARTAATYTVTFGYRS